MIYGQCTELQDRMNAIICSLPGLNWIIIINTYEECRRPIPSELAQSINLPNIEYWCIRKYILYMRIRDYVQMQNTYRLFFDMKKPPIGNIINIFLTNNMLITNEVEYLKTFFHDFESYYKAVGYHPLPKFLESYLKDTIYRKCIIAIIAVTRLYSYHNLMPSVSNMLYLCSRFKMHTYVLEEFFSLIHPSSFDIEQVKSFSVTPNILELMCLYMNIKEYFGVDIKETWYPFQKDVLCIIREHERRKRKINEVF